MNEHELRQLVDEIRRGRPEDRSLEWKRQWWPIDKPEGKQELCRDISAMANSCDDLGGHFLLGIREGRLYDAPLPRDEAEIQSIARAVSPKPNLAIDIISIEEEGVIRTISVLSVCPPFQRPYVTRLGDFNLVFLRDGSSTRTATRYDLDTFYSPPTPAPALFVVWQLWTTHITNSKPMGSADVLKISPPSERLDTINDRLARSLTAAETASLNGGWPLREHLEKFKAQRSAFLDNLKDRNHLIYWYLRQHWLNAPRFSISIRNNGARPASDVKVCIDFPEWIYVFTKKPEKPEAFVYEPFIPQKQARVDAAPSARASSFADGMRNSTPPSLFTPPSFLSAPLLQQALARPAFESSWVDLAKNSAFFWREKVRHAHTQCIEQPVSILALPSAPRIAEIEVPVTVYCEELPDLQQQMLRIKLSEARSMAEILER